MAVGSSAGERDKVLKRANPGTIQDKFLVGYQGWFTCANDGPPIGEGHHGWLHWLNQPLPPPANGRPNTDLWPDTSAYDPSELYPVAGLTHRDGTPAKVFSSRDARTVRRHFRWMAEHGVDGVFLQRFAGQVDPEEAGNRDPVYGGTRRLRDEVGQRVREAAEAEGRVWAVMYDVSGVPAAAILRVITQDFAHLVHDERIFASPAYLRDKGRPVVGVWGFGLSDSPVPPATARAVFAALRALQDVHIFAGVPSHWRTPGAGDAHADPAWGRLWLGADSAVDAISPWSVGRFGNAVEVERWAEERWGPDAEAVVAHNEALEGGARGRRVDYVPVVLPGGSGFNLSEGKWGFNGIKRDGGKFLWKQIFHAKRLRGVRVFYGAMWDEYDEGTAFLPVVEKKRLLPESDKWPFLSLDEDGYDLPADWYMRIAGFAAEGLRSERRIHDSFPSKELQDYWGTRPRYEEDGAASAASAQAAEAAAEALRERKRQEAQAQYEAWVADQQKKEAEKEESAPPPYSLEDDGPGEAVEQQQQQQPMVVPPQQQPATVSHQQPAVPPHQQSSSAAHQQPALPPQPNQDSRPAPEVDALASEFARQHITPPPVHPAHPALHAVGRQGSGGRVERPPLHPTHPQAQAQGNTPYQHVQHTGGSAGSGSSYAAQGGSHQQQQPGQQGYASHEQAQHTGGAAAGAGSYAGSQQPYQQQQQQQQHTGGSSSAGGSSYPAQAGSYQQPYQQAQHTGPSAGAPYPAQGGSQQAAYQQAQHTGGSASSYLAQAPPQPAYSSYPAHAPPHGGDAAAYNLPHGRPAPTHHNPQQDGPASSSQGRPLGYSSSVSARPPSSYPGMEGGGPGPGASLGHSSTVSARPTPSWQDASGPSVRPSSSMSPRPGSHYPGASPSQGPSVPLGAAPRPTTPSYSGYPGAAGGSGYPASPPPHGGPPLGHQQSLSARPDSVRPTTPGFAGPPHHLPGSQPPFASHNSNGPPASYPGSSGYNPAPNLPSPDSPTPSFPAGPMASQYGGAQYPGPYAHQPQSPPPGAYSSQSFPAPGSYPGSPPPGGPSYPPVSFPQQGGFDNGYFYQQPPPQPQFPGAGYSPPQADMYNYAQQPQGAWGPPPPMPHRPGSQPQPTYGPSFPSANSGPLGFAWNTVDKLAGRRTREQLEGTVDSIAQTSTKLLNKFR